VLALLSVTAATASTAGAGTTSVTHRLLVTTPDGRTLSSSSATAQANAAPALKLPTRSRVWFTVTRRTVPFPSLDSPASGAGRYVAFYFPDLEQGWAVLPDAGSIRHWPALLPFGSGVGFAPLLPGRVYSVDVAVERPARVRMPFAMHVVKVRPVSFPAAVVIHPVSLPAPVTIAVVDSATDSLGKLGLTTTAIALDWDTDPAPDENTSGDACPSPSQAMSCSGDANLIYTDETMEIGATSGGPRRVVMGEAFDSPESGAYISAYATSVPVPFNAATIYGFAMTPPGDLRL